MPFVPNAEADNKFMLEKIGVNSFDNLIEAIPNELRLKRDLDLPRQLSEFEVSKLLKQYANKNLSAESHICFMGGGAYDRFIPSIVLDTIGRAEFRTAYTPYQAEVSQGTLQAMYEFQSMICELTQMDVSNASMYDGASALAEAALLANAQTKKKDILIAGTIHPNYMSVIESICKGRQLKFRTFISEDGTCNLDALKNSIDSDTAAVIVQQPNFYGNMEDVHEIEAITHSTKALFIVSIDPISLGIMEAPGNYNADIVIGEGQSLGIPLSFGGPYLGLFACKKKFIRKIPGRITGMTVDEEGKDGFVLTLQTREQQIKREKATSNICTNQGLFMLAATVYMETMGRKGLINVAENSFHNAHYLASEINKLDAYSIAIDKEFFAEFLVETPVPVRDIIDAGQKIGLLAGVDISQFSGVKSGLLIAVTEKRNKEEMDSLVSFLKSFS